VARVARHRQIEADPLLAHPQRGFAGRDGNNADGPVGGLLTSAPAVNTSSSYKPRSIAFMGRPKFFASVFPAPTYPSFAKAGAY
jgi:hypothetical protein